ncbi:hypothetical protein [Geodermatophilus sp. DSM 44513]|uniref:hypothetical protein n=1 Tax=Geodermatophilus sp. DSM 44513 TaxID=1528104 RepID=UPI00126E8AA3|nr:hypothetical protein [Geodermatophilus sp. DSM 44513]WNV75428.1 hypothetical protein RTG05_21010 [Geodermatophilus sp. DSM 44513]
MDLKRPLVVLVTAAALAGCGSNTDLQRGEGECNAAEAGATDEELCQDTEQDNQEQSETEDDSEG